MGKKQNQKKDKKEEKNNENAKKKNTKNEKKPMITPKQEKKNEETEKKEIENPIDPKDLSIKYQQSLELVKKNLIPKIKDTQIQSALKALSLYKEKINSDGTINVLNGDFDDFIYVNFGFYKYPMRYSLASQEISISNGIYNEKNNSQICLIVKNPKSDFKDLNLEFPFRLKVIDIEKLRLKYQKYSKRRELMKAYDLFLCDNRIKFVLIKFLGNCFYSSKKFPHPISLNYEDKDKIKNDIIKAVTESTIFHMNNGPIYNIKFGRFSMKNKDNETNLKECIEQVVPHILKYDINLDELRSISIKGNNTVEFPIYNHLKEEDLKIFTGNI